MIRVYIADDHDLIRSGFTRLIGAELDMCLVGEARTAAETLQALATSTPNVLVLDIGLPDRNGLEVLKDVRTLYPRVRTLVLSMYPEDRYARRAIADGAAGYITKDAAAEELVDAIRRVHERGVYVSRGLAEDLARHPDPDAVPRHTLLSDREYQLLLFIGEGRSMQDAALQLSLSINTVNSYRRRLLQKMGLRTNPELIRYVLQHGLTE